MNIFKSLKAKTDRNHSKKTGSEKCFVCGTSKHLGKSRGKFNTLCTLSAGLLCGFLLAGILLSMSQLRAETPRRIRARWTPYRKLLEFAKALHHIEKDYVDEIDSEKLVHGAIHGMLDRLDPHSRFFPKEEYEKLLTAATGVYAGIGVTLSMEDQRMLIDKVEKGGPAYKAGIRPEDQIMKIDEMAVKGRPFEVMAEKLRGKNRTIVELTIYRRNWSAPRIMKITRMVLKEQSVTGRLILDDTAYIRVSAFHPGTARDLDSTLRKIEKQAASKKKSLGNMVLDLRSNHGGIMSEALRTADLFLSKGLLLTRRGKRGRLEEKYWADKNAPWAKLKTAVLIDGRTASAAEIVAAALKDNDRAVLVGRTSFGKGSFQELIKFAEGSVLKLTVGRYYTPRGAVLDGVGVKPDWIVQTGPPPPGTPVHKDLPAEMRDDGPFLVAIGVLAGTIGSNSTSRGRI